MNALDDDMKKSVLGEALMDQLKVIHELVSDIPEMKQDLRVLKEDVAVLKQGVSILQTDVSKIKRTLSIVEDVAHAHERDITEHRDRITALHSIS